MKNLICCLAIPLVLLGAASGVGAVQYSAAAVGICTGDGMPTDPQYHYMVGEGVNEAGQIVGVDEIHDPVTMDILRLQAFIWDPAAGLICLDDLAGGSFHAWALDINDLGQIVGYCSPGTGGWEACTWEKDGQGVYQVHGLGDLSGGAADGRALAVNNSGQIVGYSFSSNGREAFIAEKDNGLYVMTGLGDLPGGAFSSEARGINDSGLVAGVGTVGPDTLNDYEAFLWDGVSMTQISDGEHVKVEDINDLGQVLGYSTVLSARIAIWENGTWKTYSALSWPQAINNNGQVVGGRNDFPYVWDRYSGSRELPPLVDDPVLNNIRFATDINDGGQIAGGSLDYVTTGYPAVRLDPAPPFDGDGDGFLYYEDCDEARIDINPGAPEICDGVDNDCDGLVDGDDPDLGYCPPPCVDYTVKSECQADSACEWVGSPKKGHCQDVPACNPDEIPEVSCSDGVDNDCDGLTDGVDPDCGGGPEVCNDGIDNDGDGKTDCADKKDCNKDPFCN